MDEVCSVQLSGLWESQADLSQGLQLNKTRSLIFAQPNTRHNERHAMLNRADTCTSRPFRV